MRKAVLSILFILIPFTVAGGETSTCRTPDRKTYKTRTGQTSEHIDTAIIKVTEETQGKYIKILEDEIEMDHDNNWFWLRFKFKNLSSKSIATVFVYVVFYDENGNAIFDTETRVFNNRSCKSNTPITKGIIGKGVGFVKNIPPEAVNVKWRVNKIGFAINK